MNKTQRALLAALALAGTSAAMAQSSVTIYGRVNTTVERQKTGDTTVTGLYNNSSRWGVRGSEDLGGGLKAGFTLESGFASDTGVAATQFFGRQSEVNLGGNFGMLRLGNFTAESYYATADYFSMHNHDTGSSADMLYTYVMRNTNKLGYRLPAFGGFTVEGGVSLSEKATGVKNAYDLALNYGAGPLGLGLGYSSNKSEEGGAFGAFAGEGQQVAVRGSYAMGPVTLGAYYQYVTLDNVNGTTQDAKRHAYRLSAMYTMGASELHANFGRAEKIKLSGGGSAGGTAANQWTLGYNYNLSKRTKVYGYYTKLTNNVNISYLPNGTAGEDFSSFAVGVRHAF
jgi:predicted porin